MSEPRLFAPDPIDLFDPAPYMALEYYSHIVVGLASFVAAGIALWAVKGGKVHIRAGQVFVLSVFVVGASSAAMLAVAWVPPLMLAMVTAVYAVSTGWLALQPSKRWVRIGELALSILEILGLIWFLSFAIVAVQEGRVPGFAIVVLTIIPLILLAGDANFYLRAAERKTLRIRRHLARMIWALVVVVRAPLVEVVAAGLPVPPPLLVFGPIIVGALMIAWFRWRTNYWSVSKKVEVTNQSI